MASDEVERLRGLLREACDRLVAARGRLSPALTAWWLEDGGVESGDRARLREELRAEDRRRSALSKLTAGEREALGL